MFITVTATAILVAMAVMAVCFVMVCVMGAIYAGDVRQEYEAHERRMQRKRMRRMNRI